MAERIPINRSAMPDFEMYVDGLRMIWSRGQVTNDGPVLKSFETALAAYLDTDKLCLLANGTLALQLTLQAMDLRGEVITTPFTFAATTHVCHAAGLRPVFVDIEGGYFNLDPAAVEAAITPFTSAILPVHLFGHPCDMKALEIIAEQHNLKVIYDAAQAFGVRVDGKPIGRFGDASVFSLHGTKVLQAGEGGLVVYREEAVGHLLRKLRYFGFEGDLDVVVPGTNAKMNELEALMGVCNLGRLMADISHRQTLYNLYRQALSEVPGISFAAPLSGNIQYNYAYMPILVDPEDYGHDRTALMNFLKKRGIASRRYFYPLVSDYSCYRSLPRPDVPLATSVAQRILVLPMFTSLTRDEVLEICYLIAAFRTMKE